MNVTARYRIGLVMNMPGRHLGVQDDLVRAGETEVKYLGLQMVEPDDYMKVVLHHGIPFIGEGTRFDRRQVSMPGNDLHVRYVAAIFRA
jgi:hypothetical protein